MNGSRRRPRFLGSALALACALAEPSIASPLSVYISADMEGIGGVVSPTQVVRERSEYERFRSIMTKEVNAAIDAAIEAGASRILVSDSHGRGENILVEQLNPAARLVRSFPRPMDMMEGIDASFSAVIFIGYHASALTPNAVLAHTMSHRILSIKLNDLIVPEGGINAAVAGYFGVPVIMISGDHAAGEEMKKLLGDVEVADVKEGLGEFSATTVHPDVSAKLIHDASARALKRLSQFKPYRLKAPVQLDIAFVNNADAEVISWLPNVQRTAANSIRITLPDMIAVAKFINVVMFISAPGFQ
jgi:D-amino peptidase